MPPLVVLIENDLTKLCRGLLTAFMRQFLTTGLLILGMSLGVLAQDIPPFVTDHPVSILHETAVVVVCKSNLQPITLHSQTITMSYDTNPAFWAKPTRFPAHIGPFQSLSAELSLASFGTNRPALRRIIKGWIASQVIRSIQFSLISCNVSRVSGHPSVDLVINGELITSIKKFPITFRIPARIVDVFPDDRQVLITASGSQVINFSDLGFHPPRFIFGIIRVKNPFTVTITTIAKVGW